MKDKIEEHEITSKSGVKSSANEKEEYLKNKIELN